ncbi:energy-coupling factor ABC transporter permease [Cryptosporangium minutisporangium]
MHVSDGIVNLPVSAVFGVVAVTWIALSLARARRDLDDRLAPMAGLVAAFIFAVQMLNFPVLPGVSGHLLGGALAVILVGPWVGTLCVATVLLVQALLFADGGLSALGLNITNMAILTTLVAYGVVALALRVLPKNRLGIVLASFLAATVSVVVASQGFVAQYALGGEVDKALGEISLTMAGVHLLIGIGEGLITATTVATVAAVRPDLVYALRRYRRQPLLVTAAATVPPSTSDTAAPIAGSNA